MNILIEKNTARSILLEFKAKNGTTKLLKGDYFFVEDNYGETSIESMVRDVTEEIENQNFMSSIFTVFRTFNQEQDLYDIADNIMKAFQYVTIVPNFLFGILDNDDNSIKIIKHYDRFGNRFFKLKLSETSHPIIDCIRKNSICIYRDKELDGFWFDNRFQSPSLLLAIPLTCQEGPIGIVAIYTYAQELQLSKANIYHLSTLAEQISLGLERKLLADKLQVQLALFEILIESIPYPIYYRDLKTKKYRYCNSAYEIFAEKPRAEIIGKTPEEIFPQDIANFLYTKDEEAITTHQQQTYELIKEDSLGNKKIYISIRSPIILKELNEEAVVGILIDITERRNYEDELQKALDFNRLILELIPVAIFTVDTNKNITLWNKYAETITGYTAEEIIGNKCFLCDGINTFDRCELIDFRHYELPIEKEIKFVNKEGKELILSKKATQMKDKFGNLIGGLEVFEDVTLKKEIESKLSYIAETNSRLATISGLATNVEDKEILIDILLPVAIQITESNGIALIETERVNDVYTLTRLVDYKFSGKETVQLHIPFEKFINSYIGKIFVEREILTIYNPEQDKLIPEIEFLKDKRFAIVPLQSGEEIYGVILVYGKEKPYTDVELSALDRLALIFSTNIDRIKYQTELQNLLIRQYQINELHSNFINLISHEYRTPLQAVVLSAEILKKHSDKLTPEQKEKQFQRIEKAVKEMNEMLEKVILYNKLSQPQERVSFELVDTQIFFTSLVRDFMLYYQDIAKINYNINSKLDKVQVDYNLLQLIFGNIISNAVKYSQPEPVIDIDINIDKDKITLKFSDNGIGIDPKEIPNIFEPFYRGKNIKTISGTGLGLSIVRNAVELLGGNINVRSELGKGTTFEIQIPIV